MNSDLSHGGQKSILANMNLKDGSTIVANLTTVGRKTGQPRAVELRFLFFKGSFFATSSRVAGKQWCLNMLRNPAVEIKAKGEKFSCIAAQVIDETLRKQILTLRDHGDADL